MNYEPKYKLHKNTSFRRPKKECKGCGEHIDKDSRCENCGTMDNRELAVEEELPF